MSNWMTASQLATRYIVGEARLLSYSQRGNLSIRRDDDGTVYFDESMVARFFQPRGAAAITTLRVPDGPCIGVLGVMRLGDKEPRHVAGAQAESPENQGVRVMPPLSGRDARRRAVRLAPSQESQETAHAASRATGTDGPAISRHGR